MLNEPRISAKIVVTLEDVRGGGYVTCALLEGTKIECECGWSDPMPSAGVELSVLHGYAIGWCERAAYEHRKVCPGKV